jgi:hypothetical protein
VLAAGRGLLTVAALGLGCSSAAAPSVHSPPRAPTHRACEPATRVGGFTLSLVAAMPPAPELAQVVGKVSGVNWMSSLAEGGCAPGVNLIERGGARMPTVGSGGGYGGIYCFALVP